MTLYLFIKDRVEPYFAHLCNSYNRKRSSERKKWLFSEFQISKNSLGACPQTLPHSRLRRSSPLVLPMNPYFKMLTKTLPLSLLIIIVLTYLHFISRLLSSLESSLCFLQFGFQSIESMTVYSSGLRVIL